MKRHVLVLMTTLLLSACGGVGRSSLPLQNMSQPVYLTQKDTGSTVSLAQGQRLAVTLPGNSSTGYSWELVPGFESLLKHGGTEYVADNPDPGNLGGGGRFTFLFDAIGEGSASLQLVYRRTWETGVPAQTFAVTVIVGN